MLKKPFIYIALSGVMLQSCGGDDMAVYEPIEEEDKISGVTGFKLDMAIRDIPNPVEVTSDVSKSGAGYRKEILNSPPDANNYTTNLKKALNLGVYLADLSYACAYGQSQDAGAYLQASKKLADNLGIIGAFDKAIIQQFEANLGNTDTLMSVINIAYKQVDKFLRSNERVSAAALVLTGGWVEGLYITTQIIGGKGKNAENNILYKRVGMQKLSLTNLLELLNQYKEDEDIVTVIGDLEELMNKEYQYIDPVFISTRQVKSIGRKIAVIRNKMIGI